MLQNDEQLQVNLGPHSLINSPAQLASRERNLGGTNTPGHQLTIIEAPYSMALSYVQHEPRCTHSRSSENYAISHLTTVVHHKAIAQLLLEVIEQRLLHRGN
jgi:hypothetical protein